MVQCKGQTLHFQIYGMGNQVNDKLRVHSNEVSRQFFFLNNAAPEYN